MMRLIVPLVALLILSTNFVFGDNDDNNEYIPTKDVYNDFRIMLDRAIFDPLKDGERVPEGYKETKLTKYYIVQLKGPIKKEYYEELVNFGVKIYNYIPNYAYIVRMEHDVYLKVSTLNFVRWIGKYHPWYKISPYMEDISGERNFTIMYFENPKSIEDLAKSIGGKILWTDKYGIRVRMETPLVKSLIWVEDVFYVEELINPTIINDNAARIIKARQKNDGAFLNDSTCMWSYNLGKFEGTTGKGVIIAVSDTGVDGNHVDFTGKKVWYKDYLGSGSWNDPVGHGTHVAGTALGTGQGRGGKYAGMAPEAKLIGQRTISSQIASAAQNAQTLKDAQDHGALISTNSWGNPRNHGNYGSMAIAYDNGVIDADASEPGKQPMIVTFGAGNEAFTGIREPGTAKNVITVGAVGNDKDLSSDLIASFSSNGPTNDGRMKPDVLAPGKSITSCRAGTTSGYRTNDGTSMATPGVAGACAIIIQYYKENYHHTPSPALVKALLINGAVPLTSYKYPSSQQGWGRINLKNSLLSSKTHKIFWEDEKVNISTGDVKKYSLNVISASEPLKINLVWSDPAGAPNAAKELVNDLNLEVISPTGTTYKGNMFSNSVSVPGGSYDNTNNVEGCLIKNPELGAWKVKVHGANIAKDTQSYALVMSGDIDVTFDFVDLYIKDVEYPEEIMEGDMTTFKATICNRGTLPAKAFFCHFKINGRLIGNTSVSILEKNSTTEVEVKWIAKRGNYNLEIIVDPKNVIRESNETNNTYIKSLEVFYYDFAAILSAHEKNVDPGETAVFQVTMKNSGTANDTYSISVIGEKDDWIVNIPYNKMSLLAHESEKFFINITPSPLALANENMTFYLNITSLGNSSYTTNESMKVVVNQVYNLTAELNKTYFKIYPSESVDLMLNITNHGNGIDDAGITVVLRHRTPGWEWNITNRSVKIKSEHTISEIINVISPNESYAGEICTVNISVRSPFLEPIYVEAKIEILQVYDVNLSVDALTFRGLPGYPMDFEITVRNMGNGNDTFTLEILKDWKYELELSEIRLKMGYSEGTSLKLYIPHNATTGYETIPVKVIFGDNFEKIFNFTIFVEQVFDVQIWCDRLNATVYPGENITVNITVKNLGNGPDEFKIFNTRLPHNWSTSYSKEKIKMEANEEEKFVLTIGVPSSAVEGSYVIIIKAKSTGKSVVYNMTKFGVTVLKVEKQAPPKTENGNDTNLLTPSISGKESENILFYVSLLVILIAIGALIAVYIGRRKKTVDVKEMVDVRQPPIQTTSSYDEETMIASYSEQQAVPAYSDATYAQAYIGDTWESAYTYEKDYPSYDSPSYSSEYPEYDLKEQQYEQQYKEEEQYGGGQYDALHHPYYEERESYYEEQAQHSMESVLPEETREFEKKKKIKIIGETNVKENKNDMEAILKKLDELTK